MNYRREIDGLRALAVVPVMLFHAGWQTFGGGFIGVDVFFVISGYLITSIIYLEKRSGSFSLVGFYERRARRILPALFVVMFACIPFAFAWMLPDNLENFGQSLVSTTLFSNNILLWLTSGYFALESEFKPLLHTWSLGVEEQYYIVFPLLMLSLWKLGNVRIVIVLGIIAAISIVVAQYGALHNPEAAFYLLFSRAWELIIGSFVAFYLVRNESPVHYDIENGVVREGLGLVGLLFICYSVFAFDKNTPHPGYLALIPTTGAALVILFANANNICGKILGSGGLVKVGLVSYSAYLWHQPLFSFFRLRSLEEPSSYAYLVLIVLSFVLAYMTWLWVEKPCRNKSLVTRTQLVAVTAIIGIGIGGLGILLHLNSGFPQLRPELKQVSESASRGLNAAYNHSADRYERLEFSNDGAKKRVLVLGNSFARDFINAGLENGFFRHLELVYRKTNPSCLNGPADIDVDLRTLISASSVLVLASPEPALARCWKSDFQLFKNIGAKQIVVIGTKNFGWNMNAVMLMSRDQRLKYRANVLDSVVGENDSFARALPPEYYVNLLGMISDSDKRVPVVTDEGYLISQDRVHLTKEGARYIGAIIFTHPLLSDLR